MRFLILIPLLAASACTSYQYYTLSSSLPETSHDAFTFENDTLALTYTFSGNGGPVQLKIANKLDQPLIVDWKKSSVIIDGRSNAYWKDEATIHASDYSYSISGVITRPTSEGFIPPHASLESRWIQVNRKSLDLETTAFERVNYAGGTARKYTFSAENSPLFFRSYLSFRLDDHPDYFHCDHYFWVTQIHQSTSAPNSLIPSGERFYTSESTEAGTVLGVLTLGGIIWVAVAVSQEESKN